MLRLVIDTNVWLDLLVFRDASVAALHAALESGRARAFFDYHVYSELERVLDYPRKKHTLDFNAQVDCLLAVWNLADPIYESASPAALASLPRCSDPDDQKFLELALSAPADFLVTKDQALLDLAKRNLHFRILAPQEFKAFASEKFAE